MLAGAYAIAQATNYTGHSGMPWWTLTVLVIISFVFCALYGMLAATIGFYEFSSSGTGFFQMITGAFFPCRDCGTRTDAPRLVQRTSSPGSLSRTCTARSTGSTP